jgi:hypothetical protein
MTLSALSLLLAATASTPQPVARELITASVQIVAAEEIRFADLAVEAQRRTPPQKLTQKRIRDAMPMVEFY